MKTEKNILIAFLLNLSFSIFECIGGIITGSIAILSDSVHDIGDAMSIGLSYILEKKSKKKPDNIYTYGYIRYSVIGSIITSTILLTGSIFVIYEAVKRLINPQELNYNGMIIISIIGVIVNTLAAMATKEGDSLNQKSVNLHMLEDVLGWIVVLIGAILIKFTNITYIDAILSIGVALFILRHAARNIKEVLDLFLEKTPNNIDLEEIKHHLKEIKGVLDIHHIHVRSIDGFNNFITLHAQVKKYDSEIKKQIKEELESHGICHSTIELELEEEACENKTCKIEHKEHHHHHH
ncbi:MAG: cation diffusion facilitator family transporter [Bacilli bacterium]